MTQFKNLLLATNNPKKVKEIKEILGDQFSGRILTAGDFSNLPEPEETGTTFANNARIKADYYASMTGLISLADDSGLVVDALDGRPGIYSARYAETDQLRISKILNEMARVPDSLRTARFVCALCASIPGQETIEVEGTLEGSIGTIPRGNHGFGYDPIFVLKNDIRTLAELLPEEKNSISHRGASMKKIKSHLLIALRCS